jgi:hypothetical protein
MLKTCLERFIAFEVFGPTAEAEDRHKFMLLSKDDLQAVDEYLYAIDLDRHTIDAVKLDENESISSDNPELCEPLVACLRRFNLICPIDEVLVLSKKPRFTLNMSIVRSEVDMWNQNLSDIIDAYMRKPYLELDITYLKQISQHCFRIDWKIFFRELGWDFQLRKSFLIYDDGDVTDISTKKRIHTHTRQMLRNAVWDHFRHFTRRMPRVVD